MSKKKEVKYFNNRLQGSLSEKECRQLETVFKLAERNEPIEQLKNTIYTLTNDQIIKVNETGKSLPEAERPAGKLTDGQTISVGYSFISGSCLIGDSVGLGKTVETSALINLLAKNKYDNLGNSQPFRYLFLTEKTIAPQVKVELTRFTGRYVKMLEGSKKKVSKFREENELGYDNGIVAPHSLINQPEFHAWLNDLKDGDEEFKYFDLLIIDESSVLGNTKTQIYKNALKLKKYANRVILLNATPFESNLSFLYGQLNFVDETFMPTLTEFKKTYYKFTMNPSTHFKQFTGEYRNCDEFKRQVRYRYFFLTRKKLGAKIENVHSQIVTIPMSAEQKRLMKESSMHRLVYDTPSAVDPTVEVNEKTTPKLKLMREIVEKCEIDKGEQVLISVVYKNTQSVLQEFLLGLGYSVEILNGDVKKERNDIVNRFKQNKTNILITNVQKGLNFGSVKNIIFYGYDPNPSKMINMEGRITRSFDIKDKNIYLLATEGKEYDTIMNTVATRYDYTTKFASRDISGIGELLLSSLALKQG